MSYQSFEVAVDGGLLAGGVWRAERRASDADHLAPTLPVLLVHGITASHLTWPLVAEALLASGATDLVIAPDLRGRARSNGLPAPYGLRQHADDLAAVLERFAVRRAVVVGHSMGAFVAVRLAERHPERVAALLLADGGLPIPAPAGVAPEEVPAVVLGPALARLSMSFASRADYSAFWREHPAFAADWNPTIEGYIDYDLAGTEPELVASACPEAVIENAQELDGRAGYGEALAALELPVDFIRAPRGLLDQPDALYSAQGVAAAAALVPVLRVHEAVDVNHYTIVLAEHGAAQLIPLIAAHSAPRPAYGGQQSAVRETGKVTP